MHIKMCVWERADSMFNHFSSLSVSFSSTKHKIKIKAYKFLTSFSLTFSPTKHRKSQNRERENRFHIQKISSLSVNLPSNKHKITIKAYQFFTSFSLIFSATKHRKSQNIYRERERKQIQYSNIMNVIREQKQKHKIPIFFTFRQFLIIQTQTEREISDLKIYRL